MSTFLDSAYAILSTIGKPMSAQELTRRAIDEGLLRTSGATPGQTMKSKLSTDILTRHDGSRFMRTHKGEFALREWKDQRYAEYKADRYQKALLDEDVLVFEASNINKYVPRDGLSTVPLASSVELLAECRPMQRRVAEEDNSVIQLVSVFVVRHEGLVLTHMRTRRLPEDRLHGEYSMFFGGHLNPGDLPSMFDVFSDSAIPFLARELEEELCLERAPAILYKGLLYDTSRELSRQHLGIVYEVLPKSDRFEIGERGFLINAKYESFEEIHKRVEEFENWSALLLDSFKDSGRDRHC